MKLGIVAAGAAAVTVMVILTLIAMVGSETVRVVAVIATSALILWLVLPARAGKTPHWFTVFLLAMAFSSVLPAAASLVVQGAAVVIAFGAWLLSGPKRRGTRVFGWATVTLSYWALLIFHPNIPSLNVGILGFRKTVFCLIGLLIGVAMNASVARAAEQTAVRVLAASVVVSIFIHIYAPGLESSLVSRDADIYTGLFGGQARLQGVYAGPFHAATAGLILIIWGMARFRAARVEASVMVAVGGLAVYLTMVRTAYVALAVGVLAMILAQPTVGKFLRRISIALFIGVGALFVVSSVSPSSMSFLDSILEFSTDSRFLGRLGGYQEGLEAIANSPIFGWGAGAAGDTLGASFTSGFHVTPHNVVLKIAVEGGIIGLILWVGVIASTLKALPRTSDSTPLAVGVLGVVLGMGITGSSVEALPPTFFAFLIVGLAVQPRIESGFVEARGVWATSMGGSSQLSV